MHRRAIPNACWVLRLHVFDLYSERSQFAAYNGTVQYGPRKAHSNIGPILMGLSIDPRIHLKTIYSQVMLNTLRD
jgi:hypothetical protein